MVITLRERSIWGPANWPSRGSLEHTSLMLLEIYTLRSINLAYYVNIPWELLNRSLTHATVKAFKTPNNETVQRARTNTTSTLRR